MTDEELELCQTLEPKLKMAEKKLEAAEAATSPSKEVLIGGDNNPSRR